MEYRPVRFKCAPLGELDGSFLDVLHLKRLVILCICHDACDQCLLKKEQEVARSYIPSFVDLSFDILLILGLDNQRVFVNPSDKR